MTPLRLCLLLLVAMSAWPRHWKVYVVAHPHVDIGYTALIPEVERKWCEQIDEAMAATANGFKWTLETSLLFDVYERHRKPEKVRELARIVREGRIEIASLFTNIEPENAGPEELVRATFFAADRLRRQHGITVKTAMVGDVPGATWGLPRALAGTGTKYFIFAPGRYKNVHLGAEHPDLFYWKSPDGSKVLTRLGTGQYFFYASGRMFQTGDEAQVNELIKHYESLGDAYPYDAILVQVSADNGRPPTDLVEKLRKWNATHANPQAILATPSEFFGYIEDRFRAKIRELSGDFTSGWTDDPGIYARATSLKRKAASDALSAEKFAVLGELLGSDHPYPASTLEKIYRDLLIYTDHTYGISTWGWEHAPVAQARAGVNACAMDYYKESWESKKEFAYRASTAAEIALGDAVERLASRIPSDGKAIAVFNPLSWPRTGAVRLLSRAFRYGNRPCRLRDAVTGAEVPCQVLSGDSRYNELVFVARDVPAFGYKLYHPLPPGDARAPEAAPEPGVIENEFYRLEADPETGGIRSIFDKQLKRELVDRKGTTRVNQYISHILTGDHEAVYQDHRQTHLGRIWTKDYKLAVYTPMAARITAERGPAFSKLVSEIEMDHGPAPARIVQEARLYPGVRRIDFINRIRKQETLAKEELYYAFPFDVPDFQMRVELPGSVMQPGKDQLPGSFTGFSGIQHWAGVSNRDFGVTVATRDVPAIEFGEIRTNEWDREYNPKRSAFFFYFANNKENTNGAFFQGSETWKLGYLELSFSITSYAGDLATPQATRFGWEHNTPLVAEVIPTAQQGPLQAASAAFSAGLPENVILQALKRAEDGNGWVARFYECAGRQAAVSWSGLPLAPRQAFLTNLLEERIEPAKVAGRAVNFSIGPWQLVTLRLIP